MLSSPNEATHGKSTIYQHCGSHEAVADVVIRWAITLADKVYGAFDQ